MFPCCKFLNSLPNILQTENDDFMRQASRSYQFLLLMLCQAAAAAVAMKVNLINADCGCWPEVAAV